LILRVLAGLRIVLQGAFAEMIPALKRLSICENRCESVQRRYHLADTCREGRYFTPFGLGKLYANRHRCLAQQSVISL